MVMTQRDKHGNYYLKIGKSKTIFACHLDTVSNIYQDVKHVIEGNIIRTNGETTLGADDKAGVCVLLYMIEEKVPGTYYFFIGEEVGCIGSKAAAAKDDFSKYDRIISFDRKDTCSVITHQSWERCCSDDFANALSAEYCNLGLELNPDDNGVGTDSARFTGIIPECTNISVGYYDEHNFTESQDIEFLENLCVASSIIDWENLPTSRDPKVTDYKEFDVDSWCSKMDIDRARKWNHYDVSLEDDRLKDVYAYDNENSMRLNIKNKRNKEYLSEQSDIFTSYKDYLADLRFSIKDYGIIDEQFLDV